MKRSLSALNQKYNEIDWQVEKFDEKFALSPVDDNWHCISPKTRSFLATKRFNSLKEVEDYHKCLQQALAEWKKDSSTVDDIVELFIKRTQHLPEEEVERLSKVLGDRLLDLQQESRQRQEQTQEEKFEANRQKFVAECGLLTKTQIFEKYGLMYDEQIKKAVELKYISRVETTQFPYNCYPPGHSRYCRFSGYYQVLSDLVVEEINKLCLVTRLQAAEILEVDPTVFDKLKKKHELVIADEIYSSNHPGKYYVYRLSELLKIKQLEFYP